jgi:hypothetical protein
LRYPADNAWVAIALYAAFMVSARLSHRKLTSRYPIQSRPKNRRKAMSDILGLILGVGGIMLMADYLVLCERI